MGNKPMDLGDLSLHIQGLLLSMEHCYVSDWRFACHIQEISPWIFEA